MNLVNKIKRSSIKVVKFLFVTNLFLFITIDRAPSREHISLQEINNGLDIDGDGIFISDLDDDNDGIPDLIEYACESFLTGLAYWDHNGVNYILGNTYRPTEIASLGNEMIGAGITATLSSTTLQINGINAPSLSGAITNNDYIEYSFTTRGGINAIPIATLGYVKNSFAPSGNYGYTISVAVSDNNFATSDLLLIDHEVTDFVNGAQQLIWIDTDSKFIFLAPNQLYTFRIYFYNKTTTGIARFDDFTIGGRECAYVVDVDNDGIFNHQDLDSDNDGLLDAYEAGHNEVIGNDGRISGADVNSGTNGLFNPLETTTNNGVLNYFVADSEPFKDRIYDPYELDADGDGCFDTEEEAITDADDDGIVGTGIPTVDANGLVTSITYTSPPNNTWQNHLVGPCLTEICGNGIDDDGDGNKDCDDKDCKPETNPAVLNTCDHSNMAGLGVFFLHDANNTITTQIGMAISYHTTLSDTENDISPLASPYISSNTTVFARVENSIGCYNTALVTLNVGTKCVENCINGIDDDGDGLLDSDDPDCPYCGSN